MRELLMRREIEIKASKDTEAKDTETPPNSLIEMNGDQNHSKIH